MLRTHWVLMVMGQSTQRIIGIGVHAGVVDGMALCRMFNHVVARQGAPHYLSFDNDPLFGYQRWQVNLRILDVEEIKTVPYTSISHPFVERLIGAVRRELLDQTMFWNTVDLESKLLAFRDHYNRERVHSGVGGITPEEAGRRRLRGPRASEISDGEAIVAVSTSFRPRPEHQFDRDRLEPHRVTVMSGGSSKEPEGAFQDQLPMHGDETRSTHAPFALHSRSIRAPFSGP
jgi:hypothetical protein